MCQRARAVQRHAPLYSRAHQGGGLSPCRDPSRAPPPSLRSKQVWPGQPRPSRHHRHVRRALAALPATELQNPRIVTTPPRAPKPLVNLTRRAKLALPVRPTPPPSRATEPPSTLPPI